MKRAGAVAAVGVLGLLAAACGSSSSGEAGKPAENSTFTYAMVSDPGALDPATAASGFANATLYFAYDTLVHAGEDGKSVSGLAEKWDVKPDSVTFTLRKDVTCADGSKVTPVDVAANFTYIADPASKSPLLGIIVPAGLKAAADDAAGTVTLSTPQPHSFILESTHNVFIVCGKGLKDRSVLAKGTSGTGPYVLNEVVSGDRYTFTRREGYTWGPGGMTNTEPGQPGKVVLKIVSNEQTAANLLFSGAVNLGVFFGPDRPRVEAAPGLAKDTVPIAVEQIYFHQGVDRPTKELTVRKALVQALNMEELGRITTSGTGRPPKSLIMHPGPCPGDNVSGALPAYDVAAATAALDSAGWKAGPDGIRVKDGKKLTLRLAFSTASGSGGQAGVEYIADAWRKVGVDTQINAQSTIKMNETMTVTGNWDVGLFGIGLPLPSQFVGLFSGTPAPKGGNFAHLANERYDRLVAEAAKLPGEPGCAKWNEAERALVENVDVYPFVGTTWLTAGKNATAKTQGFLVIPSSIRMTKGS
ncbi:ABC transporter substrate-binding protein [Rhizohabitans arisaemae]|uniref:ABC transporter substrate-binding protein n=1 Tax=Rhizohabitans arisaemae TaxID=2720610 RepID=UPI0024B1EF33|nr:ABC transporter substrate-binding protein [Rhizohabitans arisaemae]